jgi:hypothetical protein
MSFNNIPSATNTTLTFNAASADDGNQYRAVFTNSCGTATTSAATLSVNEGSGVTTQPMNQTVCQGNTATFTAAASGSPTVQWQVSTNGGMSFTDVAAATNTTLSFTASSSQNGNRYRAVFTSSCGNATTDAATLTVNTGPGVTMNPTNQTVCAGSTATFTAAASGSPAPTVQWQVSTNGGMSFTDVAAATNTTLSFTANASQNGNQYRAVFTNSCGTATSSPATLTVNSSPTVTVFPVGQVSIGGSPVTFTAAATGSPTPTVQWQVSTNGGSTFSNIPGATNTSLTFTPTASQIGNLFRAVFTNSCGTAIAGTAEGGPGAPLLVFDCCLQDEVAKGNQIVFNSVTGDYIYCSINGPAVIGKGTVSMKGCSITLEHYAADRRIVAKADKCKRLGSASLQFPAGSTIVYITDKSWSNNTCTCGIPMQ